MSSEICLNCSVPEQGLSYYFRKNIEEFRCLRSLPRRRTNLRPRSHGVNTQYAVNSRPISAAWSSSSAFVTFLFLFVCAVKPLGHLSLRDKGAFFFLFRGNRPFTLTFHSRSKFPARPWAKGQRTPRGFPPPSVRPIWNIRL